MAFQLLRFLPHHLAMRVEPGQPRPVARIERQVIAAMAGGQPSGDLDGQSEWAWRIPLIIQGVPAIVLAIGEVIEGGPLGPPTRR